MDKSCVWKTVRTKALHLVSASQFGWPLDNFLAYATHSLINREGETQW